MATDKLAEGIRRFHQDGKKLEEYVMAMVEKSAVA
jgi:transaldolase